MEKETDRLVQEIEQLIRHQVCALLIGDSHNSEHEPVRRLADCWMERTLIHDRLLKLGALAERHVA